MVNGLDAVAISAVRKARPAEMISSLVSSPLRIRNAAHRVRAPIASSTAAPASPSASRTWVIRSSWVTPATPSAAYATSMIAAPRPIPKPVSSRPRSTERTHSSQTGPTWAATKNPRPKPVASAVKITALILSECHRRPAASEPGPWYRARPALRPAGRGGILKVGRPGVAF